jgi:hypothetical protein
MNAFNWSRIFRVFKTETYREHDENLWGHFPVQQLKY